MKCKHFGNFKIQIPYMAKEVMGEGKMINTIPKVFFPAAASFYDVF